MVCLHSHQTFIIGLFYHVIVLLEYTLFILQNSERETANQVSLAL